ncbi:MAG: hypothetical protein GX580_12100 [Candidatus Hydrogenedens sp.]|nr:hypothetical protein [Candidatus Hydrogenedentota bacterium]NLF58368.1 hypothetical protein [Candidatus Hydrogenedens sp.]
MTRRAFLLALCCWLGLALLGPCAGSVAEPRILIVGDSWAQGVWVGRLMEAALDEAGITGVESVGDTTALGGTRADQWVKPVYQQKILDALKQHPTVDSVHLIIGGNDVLGRVKDANVYETMTEEQRDRTWRAVGRNVEKIVGFCLAQPQVKHVVIGGYDYLNPKTAHEFYMLTGQNFDFGGMTQRQVNDCFVAVERHKMEMALRTEGCEYVHNFGLAQHHHGAPADAPKPGGPPDYTPFPGGDPDFPMPDAAFDRVEIGDRAYAGDGVHPSADTHKRMLRNAIDQCYAKWYGAESGGK